MRHGKKLWISSFTKKVFPAAAGILSTLVYFSCAGRPAVDSWGDAVLVTEQRAEIEQLKRDITNMGEYQLEVSGRIESITAGLTISLERCGTIEDVFREIDQFVRDLIEENRKLREVQWPDNGEDAGP